MKRLALILLFTALILSTWAQDINSFRYLSTGGALDGEVEFAFDPIDLKVLEGLRFYSALSNFMASDKILDNQGTNMLLLGYSSDHTLLKNLRSSLLVQHMKTEQALAFNYYPSPYDNFYQTGYGQGEYHWQNYYDTNGNMLYDRYHQIYQKYKSMMDRENTEINLVLSLPISQSVSLGLKSGYVSMIHGDSRASTDISGFYVGAPSTEYSETIETLPSADPFVAYWSVKETKKGDFDRSNKIDMFRNQIAGNLTKDNWDISAYYSLILLKQDMQALDLAETYWKDSDMLIAETMNAKNTFKIDYNELVNDIYARFRYTLVPAADYTRAGYISLGLGTGFGASETEAIESKFEESREAYRYSKEHSNMREALDGNSINLLANARLSLPLNQRTIIGTGLFFKNFSGKSEGTYTYTTASLDTVFNAVHQIDHTTVSQSRSLGDVRTESSFSSFRVPFGLEYWFTNNMKWAMRFGSTFIQTEEVYKEYYTPTLVEPFTVEDVYPSGNTYIYTAANESLMENTSRKDSSSHTNFSYGLCFKPSNNLQIELISMFENSNQDIWNAAFLRSLKLSFSMKL